MCRRRQCVVDTPTGQRGFIIGVHHVDNVRWLGVSVCMVGHVKCRTVLHWGCCGNLLLVECLFFLDGDWCSWFNQEIIFLKPSSIFRSIVIC
jgi:hypothetical protein